MTRDEVISAVTHAARDAVHTGGSPGSIQTLAMALEAAKAEGYGKAAREVASAIMEELSEVPAAPTAAQAKGIWVTVTVTWRLSKPPEMQPQWSASLDGKGKKALHSFHKSFYLTPEVFYETMETKPGIGKLEKLIYDHIEKQTKGEPAWLVYADVRLGRVKSGWAGGAQAAKLPSALHYSYWQNKSGLETASKPGVTYPSDDPTEPGFQPFGPAKGWWWTRPKFGGGYVYESAKLE